MHEPNTEKTKKAPPINGLKSSETKSKKREKYIPNSEPLALPFCRICGKRASGIHFGVYSCEACKAFFRRYLQRQTPFICNKGDKCVIDEQKKGLNCSACRLKKCLEKGMSKEGVRIGRYSTAERTNVIMEVKRLHASIESNSTDVPCPQPTDHMIRNAKILQVTLDTPEISGDIVMLKDSVFCANDTHTVARSSSDDSSKSLSDHTENSSTTSDYPLLIDTGLSPSSSGSVDSIGSLLLGSTGSEILSPKIVSPEIVSPEIFSPSSLESICSQLVLPGDTLLSEQEETDQIMEQLMTGYQCLQPYSKSLTDEELNEVLKYGLEQYEEKVRLFGKMEYLSIQEYREIYDKTKIDVDGRKELYALGREELNKMFKELVQFSHSIINFTSLPSKDQAALFKATDFDFSMLVDYRCLDPDRGMYLSYTGKPMSMSESCPHTDIESLKQWGEFCRHIQKLRLTPREHALMLAISLTFQDRCPVPLEARDEVEKIQSKLIKTLQKLVADTNQGSGGGRFAKLMDVFVRLRGMSKSYEDAVKSMSKDEFLIECIPEILFYL